MRKCALVTGVNGFTGAYMRAELEEAGYTVIGTVIGTLANAGEITLDITSAEQCRDVMETIRPDFVVHLAAISFVHLADAAAFYQVNVVGTLNLLQAIADAGLAPECVLIASSANVYGNSNGGIIDERQMPQPVNHYATSKLAMEYMARTWCNKLPIVIARPFNYTGVGQAEHFLVPKIVAHFARRELVIELGNLDIERDFSDVRMVVSAYRALLERARGGEIVNVCSGRPYALRDIVTMMEELTGQTIAVKINPAFVRSSEVKTLVGSPQKLREIAGPLPQIPLRDTLRWMAASSKILAVLQ